MPIGECTYCGSLQPCRACPSCPDDHNFAHMCAVAYLIPAEQGPGSEGEEVCYTCADRLGLLFQNCVYCGQPGGATEDGENLRICKTFCCDARIHAKCKPSTGKCPKHAGASDNHVVMVEPRPEDSAVVVEHAAEESASVVDEDVRILDPPLGVSAAVANAKPADDADMVEEEVLLLEPPPANNNSKPADNAAEEPMDVVDENNVQPLKRNRPVEQSASAPPAKKRSAATVDVKCDYVWCKSTLQKYHPCEGCNSDKQYHLACALIRYEQQLQRSSKVYDAIFTHRKQPGFPILCVGCAVKFKLPRLDLVPVNPGPHDTKWEIEGPAFSTPRNGHHPPVGLSVL
jgi:hypothetical protein